ncbi:MAG: ATP-binding protein [Bacteroidetes bacterium]|nr:ATP-binding protein [Bacteroidota bacterium]
MLVSASTSQIAEVRDFVGHHAEAYGFSAEDVHDIKLAVDEAYTNVIKHAYKFDDTKKVQVKILTGEKEFTISLSDEGVAFDPSAYTEPNVAERIMLRKRGGVGVYLIHKLMDHVEYRNEGTHNEILMSKKR